MDINWVIELVNKERKGHVQLFKMSHCFSKSGHLICSAILQSY